jgi:hypothetical protein
MKTALSRILEFFARHDRREQNDPVQHTYCICGALKPEAKRPEREASFKTERRPQNFYR